MGEQQLTEMGREQPLTEMEREQQPTEMEREQPLTEMEREQQLTEMEREQPLTMEKKQPLGTGGGLINAASSGTKKKRPNVTNKIINRMFRYIETYFQKRQ